MGFRYRKTKTFKNGAKVSAGKKSAGVSFGNRHVGVSLNSKRGVHVRASIPGTGVSYSARIGRKGRKLKKAGPSRLATLLTAILFMALVSWAVPVLIPVFVLAIVGIFVWSFISAKREQQANQSVDDAAATIAPSEKHIEVACPCSEKFRAVIRKPGGVMLFTCPKCGRQLRVDTSEEKV